MSEKKPGLDPAIPWIAKSRPCLMCRRSFTSQWSGERVCPKCKGSWDWRTGDPTLGGTRDPSGEGLA